MNVPKLKSIKCFEKLFKDDKTVNWFGNTYQIEFEILQSYIKIKIIKTSATKHYVSIWEYYYNDGKAKPVNGYMKKRNYRSKEKYNAPENHISDLKNFIKRVNDIIYDMKKDNEC